MPMPAPDRRSTLSTRLLAAGGAFSSTQHELVTLAARFEASNEWILDGAPSAAHWMADQLDVSHLKLPPGSSPQSTPPSCAPPPHRP